VIVAADSSPLIILAKLRGLAFSISFTSAFKLHPKFMAKCGLSMNRPPWESMADSAKISMPSLS
jgi:hypothetical protein